LENRRADRTMKSVMEQEQTQKKYSPDAQFWIVWGIAAGVILLGLGVYGWKTLAFEKENKRFEVSIENTQKRIQALAPASDQVVKKRNESIKKAKNYRKDWSHIMKQIVGLETGAVRFTSVGLSGKKLSVSCQAMSWKSFSAFFDSLEKDPRVKNARISSTTLLSPSIAEAKQSAELTFDFSPTPNENT